MAAAGTTDAHRLFIQGCLSKKILTLEQAHELYVSVATLYDGPTDEYENFVDIVSRNLQTVQLDFKSAIGEHDGVTYVAIVNTKNDAFSQISTTFTPAEVAFFKRLLDLLVDKNRNGSLSVMDALNVRDAPEPNLTLNGDDAETALERFRDHEWISTEDRAEEGTYFSLAPRSFMELGDQLHELAGEDSECTICLLLVIKGERCDSCNVVMHYKCAHTFFEKRARECPTCKSAWPDTPAEAAVVARNMAPPPVQSPPHKKQAAAQQEEGGRRPSRQNERPPPASSAPKRSSRSAK